MMYTAINVPKQVLLISRRQGGVWEERAIGGLGYDEWEGGDIMYFCKEVAVMYGDSAPLYF